MVVKFRMKGLLTDRGSRGAARSILVCSVKLCLY